MPSEESSQYIMDNIKRFRSFSRGLSYCFEMPGLVRLIGLPMRDATRRPQTQYSSISANSSLESTRITLNMDRQSTYSLSIFGDRDHGDGLDSRLSVQQKLIDFILAFQLDNQYIYR